MGFSLLNVILWPLLALAALPLLIHLFARARPPAYRYSSIEFVQRVVRHTQRIRRPRDWFLWLVRTAIMIFLAMLFLRPLVFGDHRLAAPNEPKTVVLIVDASASMAVLDGAQSRFVTACAEASDILAGLSEGDRANLIWLRAVPEAVFPTPGVNIRYLRNALREARVRHELGRPRDALRAAIDMLREAEGRKEIYVISDFQATNWRDATLTVPHDVRLARVQIGESEPENLAITRIHTQPAQPLAGEPVTVFAEIENYSARMRRTPVYLEFGELRERQEIALAPRERVSVVFAVGAHQAGGHPLTIRIDEDEFPGDNVRHTILRVRPYLRVGIVNKDEQTAEAWRRALKASGVMAAVEVSATGWDAGQPLDALMLAGWDGATSDAVREYLHAGGLVVWAPAPDTPTSRVDDLAGRATGLATADTLAWQAAPRDRAFRLRMGDRDDPLFRIFAGGEFGDPTRGVFTGRLQMGKPAIRDARTLFWYEDEVPALTHWPVGQGRLFLWNIPLQPAASDWPQRMEFLPFLCELVLTYRAAHAGSEQRLEFEPGERLSYRPEQDILETDIALRTPGGELLAVTRHETDGGPIFFSPSLHAQGVYTWRLRDESVMHQVVNFPSAESDLRATEAVFEAEEWVELDRGRDARVMREGREIWQLCLLLVFALAMVEAGALMGGRRP